MIVEVLQPNGGVPGKIGAHVKIDPAMGNYYASIGVVRVVSHEAKTGPAAKMEKTENPKRKADDDDAE